MVKSLDQTVETLHRMVESLHQMGESLHEMVESLHRMVECLDLHRFPARMMPPCSLLGYSSQFKNNYLTEMCSGSEAGSYLRLIDLCITQLSNKEAPVQVPRANDGPALLARVRRDHPRGTIPCLGFRV